MNSRISRTLLGIAASAALMAAAPLFAGAGGAWRVFETARDNGHLLAEVPAPDGQLQAGAPVLACDPATRFQTMEGFGGALTESSAWVLDQLPPASRQDVVRHYYDPKVGIGYTLARTHINSCDFSLGGWALDPVEGDTALSRFSLDPMRRWVLPLIHEAQNAAGADRFHLLASPWSPPSWMKTNGRMTNGGALIPAYRQAWADYLVRFVQAMEREEHIPVWALTVQNEPSAVQTWESCIFTASEERDFVRDHLGPALDRAGLSSLHLCVLDHNRDMIDAWTRTILGDPQTARYVWGTAIHWYVSEDYAAASRAHDAFPSKPILFTEGCVEGPLDPALHGRGKWEHGERYAHSMIHDFNNSVCGWIDWNIVLDQTGGPNHVGNFCYAPVIADTETGAIHYQTSFYYIGQFSRFVHPGAVRIGLAGGPSALESVAFANPDGTVVVVALNRSVSALEFTLDMAGEKRACRLPAHAIQTYVRTL